jgi:hypothetical protein
VALAQYAGKPALPRALDDYPAPDPVDAKASVSALSLKDPLQFWDILVRAMNENPPPADQISALVPMFKPLGIEFGKPWDRSKVAPPVLAAMAEAATEIGAEVGKLLSGRIDHFAFLPAPTIGNFGTDYLNRAVIARVGLTANTPEEAVYWTYTLDSEGQALSGDRNYTLTLPSDIPFEQPGFWSITMYDSATNYTVGNPINRYMVGSDSKTLKRGPNGSITIYIQKESPGPDKDTNWLPSPAGRFYLIPRAYVPKPETIRLLSDASAWPVPGAERAH